MKTYKWLILTGFIDMLSFIIIEMFIQIFISDLDFLTALSIFGIIITLLNISCLYLAFKNNLNMIVKILLLFAIAYGIYSIISIHSLSFRIPMILVGFLILVFNRQKTAE